MPDPAPPSKHETTGAAASRVAWISRGTLAAWLVLALALAGTLFSWNHARDLAEQRTQMHLDSMADEARNQLDRQLHLYAQVLHASAAFFNASINPSRAEWRDFVSALALEHNFPGIERVGFSSAVEAEKKESHQRQMNADGLANYRIHPPGGGALHAPIIYLEPLTEGAARLLGWDMYTDPDRRAAMENARDFGGAAITGKLKMQREGQPGFVMYVAVYRHGTTPVTRDERRAAIAGWVFAPLQMNDFIAEALGKRPYSIALAIHEIDEAGKNIPIFDSRSGADSGATPLGWTRQIVLPVADRKWQLRFSAPYSPTQESDNTPQLILCGGIIISMLLFAVVMTLATMRVRAQALAGRLTQELRTSNELLESHVAERTAELQTVLSASPIPIAHVVGGRFRWVSSAVEAMTGYQAKDLIGQSTQMLFEGDAQSGAAQQASLPLAFAAGVRQIEQTLITRDGRRLDCESYLKPIDPDNPGRGTVSIFLDVTERRRNEIALRESEHFNRMLFEASPVGLVLCRMDGSLVDVNQAYATILDRSIDEVIGLNYWEITPDRYAPAEAAHMQSLRDTGRYGPYEKEYIRSDGRLVPVRLSGRVIERAGESFIWSAVEDITESRAAARKIDEYVARVELQNARLAESDRVKTEFLNNMSHELKTPLNAIIGFSELLAEGIPQPLDPQQQEYAKEIMDAGKHLLNLINDILMYSRSEAGQLKLHPETVAVSAFMARRMKNFEAAAAQKDITLSLAIAPECTVFLADRNYLRTIIDQLLSNAIKFTPQGGQVSLSAALDDIEDQPAQPGGIARTGRARQIEIVIADTGIGIAAEDMERVFEPFTQADGKVTRQSGGTGIGLALIRRLVEGHDGTLVVDSAPGQGSKFRIRLPWADVDEIMQQPDV
ncbi:MAG: CHASE domain-containing protein [Pseudomonadota bacterium]